ncbi:membrane-associated protein, putative [Bodo saltans]|uniref:Membrane-associated protein, putative n=1 Tax=Bodo saltans TaxID=75058 RepID=A0A0S4JUZ1_BODSA|nr:membrane-associated protein, putative [Bodo saltans]|eukprot:CUG93263.1 membrane-associated protein, putative [Bodo saltans]
MSNTALISGLLAAIIVLGAFGIGVHEMTPSGGYATFYNTIVNWVVTFDRTLAGWLFFYALFIGAVLAGGLYSWIHGKIVCARPHTRPTGLC